MHKLNLLILKLFLIYILNYFVEYSRFSCKKDKKKLKIIIKLKFCFILYSINLLIFLNFV